jgi:hypothetical protein
MIDLDEETLRELELTRKMLRVQACAPALHPIKINNKI